MSREQEQKQAEQIKEMFENYISDDDHKDEVSPEYHYRNGFRAGYECKRVEAMARSRDLFKLVDRIINVTCETGTEAGGYRDICKILNEYFPNGLGVAAIIPTAEND